MKKDSVDYDHIAANYNKRYTAKRMAGVQTHLENLLRSLEPKRVLEVGCGTGHWLEVLHPLAGGIYGLDLSRGMLQKAAERPVPVNLIQGRAGQLPLVDGYFDLLYCVNALHHFDSHTAFLREARRLLYPSGTLVIIGLTPHERKSRWYGYEYFPGTYETDIRRFPTWGSLMDELVAMDVSHIEWKWAERIEHTYYGREVLQDPFLPRESTSQLALLSEEEYTQSLRRLEKAVAEAEKCSVKLAFPANVYLGMLTAHF